MQIMLNIQNTLYDTIMIEWEGVKQENMHTYERHV